MLASAAVVVGLAPRGDGRRDRAPLGKDSVSGGFDVWTKYVSNRLLIFKC